MISASQVDQNFVTLRDGIEEYQRQKSKPVISEGEWVTCTNGHRICRCIETQYADDPVRTSVFDKWKIDVPSEPTVVMPRCYCGEPWTQGRYEGKRVIRIHIEGRGWSADG